MIIACFIDQLIDWLLDENIQVYVWSRRNPSIRMNFFGMITFNAPYLPYVLLAFTLLLGNSIVVDIMG